MSDELIKRLRRWANFGYGVNASKCMIEACDALEESNTVMSKANAALEAANARIAELATDLERTRHQRNAAHVEARREIDKEYRDRIAALESAGKAEPIYQERTVNGFWQDVSKELHDSISAGRVRSEGVRIVYTAPAALAQPLEAQADARDAERWRFVAKHAVILDASVEGMISITIAKDADSGACEIAAERAVDELSQKAGEQQ